MSAPKHRATIRRLLKHPHVTAEIVDGLKRALAWLSAHQKLTATWVVRLMRYDDALRLASEREERGETPFVDMPRERVAVKPGRRPRTLEARAEHTVAHELPAWMSDRSLLPMRPPGGRP